jgi:hypothetical protein
MIETNQGAARELAQIFYVILAAEFTSYYFIIGIKVSCKHFMLNSVIVVILFLLVVS